VDWELIIVDGASTDGTLDAIKPYLNDPRIILDSRKDSGIYAAINRGIAQARGQNIGILNADDAYLDGALVQVQNALRLGADFCYGPVIWRNQKNQQSIRIQPLSCALWLTQGLQKMPSPHVGFFLRAINYHQIGGYDETLRIAADHEFLLRVAQRKLSGVALNEPIAELLSGGISAGARAKWQSMLVALRYGRSRHVAFIVFVKQVLVSWLITVFPYIWLAKLKLQSRYQLELENRK
jgi:glycosyltransferase involved in cell wall biosynthesis